MLGLHVASQNENPSPSRPEAQRAGSREPSVRVCFFVMRAPLSPLPAARRSRVGVLHFVARDHYGSLLIGPVPEPQFPKWNRENHFAADVPSPTVG
jgi:hypothetical protein